jgi:glycosyltransferase involved in cell wall biosynthesis
VVLGPADLPPPPEGRTGWPWTEGTPSELHRESGPLITIVTPSFNQGHFIEETIRSVLLQGYRPLEYIVMDGGSNDSTVDVLRKYERWLTRWVSEPDDGQSDAIVKGMLEARGTLRNWLNADDYLLPGALAALADAWNLSDDAPAVLCGDSIDVDVDGIELSKSFAKEPNELMVPGAPPLIGGDQSAWFFSEGAWNAVGGIDRSHRFIMDIDLYYRFAAAGVAFQRVGAPLSAYRRHSDTKTLNEWEASIDSKKKYFSDLVSRLPEEARPKSERNLRHYYRGLYLGSVQPDDRLKARTTKILKAIREDPRLLSKPYQVRRLLKLFVTRTDPDRR